MGAGTGTDGRTVYYGGVAMVDHTFYRPGISMLVWPCCMCAAGMPPSTHTHAHTRTHTHTHAHTHVHTHTCTHTHTHTCMHTHIHMDTRACTHTHTRLSDSVVVLCCGPWADTFIFGQIQILQLL